MALFSALQQYEYQGGGFVEVQTSGYEKRTILTMLDPNDRGHEVYGILAWNFEVVVCYSVEEFLEKLAGRYLDLSVAIVDVDIAQEDDCALLRTISSNQHYNSIPVLIMSKRPLVDSDMRCLDEGAVDFLMRPYFSHLLKQRVENAINLKRMEAFYELESMLCELPSNIFLKDTECRYVFCTHYWHHLDMPDDPDWSIRGLTDMDIRKDKENAAKAMEADREIIRTGKGTNYVIEINVDDTQEFMELIKRPVFDKDGNVAGIIALINDVTERELLKRDLEVRAHTDELTGLGNHRSFADYVEEVKYRNDFPIGVISADCDKLKRVNDTFGHLVGDEYIRRSALAVESALPEGSSAFRTGGDEFIAFLPGKSLEETEEVIQVAHSKLGDFKLDECDLSISFGAAVISNQDENVLDVIANADRIMYAYKAKHRRARATDVKDER